VGQSTHQFQANAQPAILEQQACLTSPPGKWHFGAYSDSQSGLSNSDEKKMTHPRDLQKTPEGKKTGAMPSSPQDFQKIGFNKQVVSPKTPEQLMSNHRLEKSQTLLTQSKSINGSGDRSQPIAEVDIEVEKAVGLTQDIKLGQDVYQVPDNFICTQFLQESPPDQDGAQAVKNSSSIFSTTPFRAERNVAKALNYEQPTAGFNIDESIQLKTQPGQPTGLNAMSLFAYNEFSDSFANAFQTPSLAQQSLYKQASAPTRPTQQVMEPQGPASLATIVS